MRLRRYGRAKQGTPLRERTSQSFTERSKAVRLPPMPANWHMISSEQVLNQVESTMHFQRVRNDEKLRSEFFENFSHLKILRKVLEISHYLLQRFAFHHTPPINVSKSTIAGKERTQIFLLISTQHIEK